MTSIEQRALGNGWHKLMPNLRCAQRLHAVRSEAPIGMAGMHAKAVSLNADVYAGDVLRSAYREQMDRHASLAARATDLRNTLERIEADQRTAAERATSIMETLARYGGMLAPDQSA